MRRWYSVEGRGESAPHRHNEPTVALFDSAASGDIEAASLLGGLFIIVGGNVVWRLACAAGCWVQLTGQS